MVKYLLTTLLILTSCNIAPAENADTLSGHEINESKKSSLIGFPIFFYTPETKFAGGAAAGYIRRPDYPGNKPSTAITNLVYTQKNQIIAAFSTDIYWDSSNYNFIGNISYLKFPNTFYGIGTSTLEDNKEDFTPEQFAFDLRLKYQFLPGIYAGLGYEFENFALIETDPDGILGQEVIRGNKGGKISRVMGILTYDSRDDVFWPSKGFLSRLTLGVSEGLFGSDFNFTEFTFDSRSYHHIADKLVLANQMRYSRVNGGAPFYRLPGLGGESTMRGYYDGRFTDKNMYAIQSEIRVPIWWKIGAVAFGGIGDVSESINDFQIKNIKHSYGFGLRFRINSDDLANIRFDYGIGAKTSGFYISFAEAF